MVASVMGVPVPACVTLPVISRACAASDASGATARKRESDAAIRRRTETPRRERRMVGVFGVRTPEGTATTRRCVATRFRLHLYGNSTRQRAVASHEFDRCIPRRTRCQERCKRRLRAAHFIQSRIVPDRESQHGRQIRRDFPTARCHPIRSRPDSSATGLSPRPRPRVRAGRHRQSRSGTRHSRLRRHGPGRRRRRRTSSTQPGVRVDDPGHPDLPTDPDTARVGDRRHRSAAPRRRDIGRARAPRSRKDLPLAGGQGGSAASAIAGAVAANALLGSPLDTHELLLAALVAEERVAGRHLDNLAPALARRHRPRALDRSARRSFASPRRRRFASCSCIRRCNCAPPTRAPCSRRRRSRDVDGAGGRRRDDGRGVLRPAISTLLRGAIDDRIAEPARASLLPGFARAKARRARRRRARLLDRRRRPVVVRDGRRRRRRRAGARGDARRVSRRAASHATGRVARVDERGARVDHGERRTRAAHGATHDCATRPAVRAVRRNASASSIRRRRVRAAAACSSSMHAFATDARRASRDASPRAVAPCAGRTRRACGAIASSCCRRRPTTASSRIPRATRRCSSARARRRVGRR